MAFRIYSLYYLLMELILLKPDSPEWNYAWDWVYAHPINEGLTQPELNSWQYRGSLRNGDRILHQFWKAGKSLILACSPNMSDSDIAQVIKLK